MRWGLLTYPLLFALAGCTSPPSRTDTPGDETAAAHKLYVTKCAKCHKFYEPARYSDEDWKIWMGKMSKKAKLSGYQAEILSRYIDETFRNAARTNTNSL
jgi:hypothetical protein